MGNIVKLTDIGENETLIDYAVRKEEECNELRDHIASLRDWIHQIAVNSGNEQFIIDATGAALSGEECNQQMVVYRNENSGVAEINNSIAESNVSQTHC